MPVFSECREIRRLVFADHAAEFFFLGVGNDPRQALKRGSLASQKQSDCFDVGGHLSAQSDFPDDLIQWKFSL